uniref:Uncharacterized protein n=1 Tax=Tanacetum cinerariifolium TaxID=118510 RepID=A0A699IKT4_TANCI|nr:hypothetical protein [Tanacetum cinerariifolium]
MFISGDYAYACLDGKSLGTLVNSDFNISNVTFCKTSLLRSFSRTSWNEFSSSMALAVICLSIELMMRAQVGDLSSHCTKYSSPTLTQKVFANMRRAGKGFFEVDAHLFKGMIVAQQDDYVADEGAASVVIDDVPVAVDEPFIPSPTPTTEPPLPSQDLPSTSQVQPTPPPSPFAQPPSSQQQPQSSQDAEIPMDLLHTLLETCTTLTRRGSIIASMDADEDVTLKDVADITKEVAVDAEIKESADVLSMPNDELEPTELQEVVTTAKLMTEVVTVASTTITDAALTAAPSAAKRRKGVIIRDPEETTTPSIIIHLEPKSKEKGKRILVEEPKPFKKQAQIEQDEAYTRENMAGFEMDYFKGMSYDDIRPIFERYFNYNVAFLEKTKEQMEEEDSRALKRANESQAEKPAKRQKEDLEVIWQLVNERFTSSKPKNFSDDFLLTTLTYMFKKPDVQAQMILLVERRYPLTRFTLDQMLNNVRLEVKEESEVSLELPRFVRQQQQEGFRPE